MNINYGGIAMIEFKIVYGGKGASERIQDSWEEGLIDKGNKEKFETTEKKRVFNWNVLILEKEFS